MTRLIALLSLVVAWLGPATPVARAVIGANDVVPAATLLLPYFEVSLDPLSRSTTVVSIINSDASSALARVNLWTDEGLPTRSFFVYLTGYDIEVIDLRQLFVHGLVPQAASAGQDPNDQLSPKGPVTQDINFGTCTGRLPHGRISAADRTELIAAHTGQASALFGGACGASRVGLAPDIARGFITIDSVAGCTDNVADSPAYVALELDQFRNNIIGFFEIRDDANNLSFVDDLVHIEASRSDPLTDGAGDATFYGHLSGWAGADHREPLSPRWRAKYEAAGAWTDSDVIVWRWPAAPRVSFACDAPPAALVAREVLVFDEQENLVDATAAGLFPRVSMRLSLAGNAAIPYAFGLLDIDLRAPAGATDGPPSDPTFRSGAVFVQRRSAGRFGVGMPAVALPIGGVP